MYAGVNITPEIRVTAGHLREERITSDQRNRATYGVLTVDVNHPNWGRLKVMEVLKSVADDIPDDLIQWDNRNTLRDSRNVEVPDPLLARDALNNSLYIGHHVRAAGGFDD